MIMMKIGDRVEVLDDTISGIIIAIEGESITLETDDGFPITFHIDEVVKVGKLEIDHRDLEEAISQKKLGIKKKNKNNFKRKKQEKALEVDLHVENLMGSRKNMSDFEMLNLQLNTARGQLEFAIKNHIRKVVFIHGVGKGVLRMELETIFRRYDQVKFYDADFKKYGRGATEVYIFQNL